MHPRLFSFVSFVAFCEKNSLSALFAPPRFPSAYFAYFAVPCPLRSLLFKSGPCSSKQIRPQTMGCGVNTALLLLQNAPQSPNEIKFARR